MKEIIYISLGEYSNNISTHFWNLNLELTKNKDLELNRSVLYNDYDQPRALIFDTSVNFKNYFSKNAFKNQSRLCIFYFCMYT